MWTFKENKKAEIISETKTTETFKCFSLNSIPGGHK